MMNMWQNFATNIIETKLASHTTSQIIRFCVDQQAKNIISQNCERETTDLIGRNIPGYHKISFTLSNLISRHVI